jgi:hypothetical protein
VLGVLLGTQPAAAAAVHIGAVVSQGIQHKPYYSNVYPDAPGLSCDGCASDGIQLLLLLQLGVLLLWYNKISDSY